ncbi:hypothetical protein RHSIM_Rhsim05G0130900 [Rhododendron simsii]|uniref:Uncharacterized protein n=1 Tax=Rhododendron simsii TaxID=118357 RepID=A0A834GXL7_RHOSS|nr:hypothetical protein RHSIM_Rhsim05G0130900 [Rhododendron simsii]
MCCWWWLWPTNMVEEASAVAGVGCVGWCGGSERTEKREMGREGEGQNGGGSGVGDVDGLLLGDRFRGIVYMRESPVEFFVENKNIVGLIT